jgi:uncharacterized protein (DUF983 family)
MRGADCEDVDHSADDEYEESYEARWRGDCPKCYPKKGTLRYASNTGRFYCPVCGYDVGPEDDRP